MGIIFSFHWITFIIARIFCNTKVVMRANEPRSRCQLLSNTDAWLLLPLFYNNIGNAYIMSGAKITRSSLDHNRSDLYGKRWTILQWYWSKRGHIRTNTCLATHKHSQRVNVDNLNEAREREKEKKLEKFGFHVNHRVEESKSVMIFPYELGYRDFNISRFLAWRMRHGFIVYLFNLFQFFSIDSTELRISILYVFVFAIVFSSLAVFWFRRFSFSPTETNGEFLNSHEFFSPLFTQRTTLFQLLISTADQNITNIN